MMARPKRERMKKESELTEKKDYRKFLIRRDKIDQIEKNSIFKKLDKHKLWLATDGREGTKLLITWSTNNIGCYYGINFQRMDFRHADLSSFNCRHCNFDYANLSYSKIGFYNLGIFPKKNSFYKTIIDKTQKKYFSSEQLKDMIII